MQNQNKQPQTKQNAHNRYSIFHNPLFQANQAPLFQKVPFHITIQQENGYEYVIDHINNHIQKRQSINKGNDKRSQRSQSQRKRIFSVRKRDQSGIINGLSPVELIKGRDDHSSERESRKYKIFGNYATINYNEGRHSYQPKITNMHNLTDHISIPQLTLIKQQSQPIQNNSKSDKKNGELAVNKNISVREQLLNPIQFAKFMFDTRLSQRLRQQKHRQKQETRVTKMATIQPQMYLR